MNGKERSAHLYSNETPALNCTLSWLSDRVLTYSSVLVSACREPLNSQLELSARTPLPLLIEFAAAAADSVFSALDQLSWSVSVLVCFFDFRSNFFSVGCQFMSMFATRLFLPLMMMVMAIHLILLFI